MSTSPALTQDQLKALVGQAALASAQAGPLTQPQIDLLSLVNNRTMASTSCPRGSWVSVLLIRSIY